MKAKKVVYNIYKIVYFKVVQVIKHDVYTSYSVDLKLVKQCDTKNEVLKALNITELNGINHGLTISKCQENFIAKAVHTAKGYTVIKDVIKFSNDEMDGLN